MSERHVTFDMIVHAVCAVSDRTSYELLSQGRGTAELARLRHVCWWLARKMTTLSIATIGRLTGDRDHSTVINGIDAIEQLRAADERFRLQTDTLLGTLVALERAGLTRLAAGADPLATARRVLAAPEREATRVPVAEIVAMSRLIVELLGDSDTPTPSPTQETEDAA